MTGASVLGLDWAAAAEVVVLLALVAGVDCWLTPAFVVVPVLDSAGS
ncbi:MAG TPA: hypothetical protein VGO83_07735 [Thermoleophilaceae bacterium]|nr:hypothetical protein [Thermoleophilaceae bacterium]